ncbi:sphingomyelin phosphodiesterase-like [Dermatophagoides farinae]|uniref:sphingomyelin phosphodiesterase-like n=1 Tax=Dermatophagoides farinae TaxID=6954 RepID=UPI003F5EEC37
MNRFNIAILIIIHICSILLSNKSNQVNCRIDENSIKSFKDNGIVKTVITLDKMEPSVKMDDRYETENWIDNHLNPNEPSLSPSSSPNADKGSSTSTMVIGLLKKAFRLLNLKQMVKNVQQGRSSSGTCLACKITMTGIKYLIDYGRGFEDVAYVTKYLCKTLALQTDRVCDGYEEFVVVMSQVNISSNEVCGFLLGETCNSVAHPLYKWNVRLPDRPLFTKPLFRWPFRAQQSFKVLQISDLHIDLEYRENSNAVCNEPLCCRADSPPSTSSTTKVKTSHRAGYWGDYRDCDVPLRLVDQTFQWIRQNHPDIEYILWTGDIPPHDIWNQTKQSQLEYIDIAGHLFDKYFSHVPIYPVVGNHESLPMNSFPLYSHPAIKQKYSKQWLYDRLSSIWLRWGAYFATRAKKGLKIISLNTNFCNTQNWWVLLNATDPGQQLEWLIQQLTESERLGEMVQIIGHVPPGSNDCAQIWSMNYNQIINRFASIIKGQFFGHTHNDEFEIFYREVRPELDSDHETTYMPTNVAYIGPSVTTFGNVNPGYRIYVIDQQTFDIIDHETYFLNLTEANLARDRMPPQYRLSYRARQAYEMKTLSPTEWHRLVMRMRTPISRKERSARRMQESNRLFKYFHHYFYNLSDNIGDENKCDDENCKYEMLCRLLTAHSYNTTLCQHFLL